MLARVEQARVLVLVLGNFCFVLFELQCLLMFLSFRSRVGSRVGSRQTSRQGSRTGRFVFVEKKKHFSFFLKKLLFIHYSRTGSPTRGINDKKAFK